MTRRLGITRSEIRRKFHVCAQAAALLSLWGCQGQRLSATTAARVVRIGPIAYTVPKGAEASVDERAETIAVSFLALPGGFVRIQPSVWRPGSESMDDALRTVFENVAPKVEAKNRGAVKMAPPEYLDVGPFHGYGGAWKVGRRDRLSLVYFAVKKKIYQLSAYLPATEGESAKAARDGLRDFIRSIHSSERS